MEQALTLYHTDVAVALYRVYWLDFVYCPSGKGSWFQFKNHRWYEVKQAVDLRKVISSDFRKRFEFARMVLCQQGHESNDQAFKDNVELTVRKITSLIGKLKTVPFKSSLVTEACEQFSNDRFISLMDSHPEITGVTNGVLEVQTDNILHRAAKPEDFVSMCMGVPFHSNYNWSHPLVQKCMHWFGQVFTDRLLLHHFLKFAASCLKGRNSDKIFPIFTGEGDNSKSMIVKLFEATFASYCIKFDISNVTGRNMNAGGASPQLARAKSTRVAFMDEPEDDVPMHKGIIKKWVGGDSFFARFLHDNGGDQAVTFKLVLTCNKVPIIPNADTAIKNRTRLFPFLSTWVDNPPEDENEQARTGFFKKNPFFERDIPVMAPAFLWIMTEYYPRYAVEKLIDPPIVTETTEAYWRDNDVYAQFASDTIQEVYTPAGDRDTSARATLSTVYSEFKLWFKDAFPGTKPPERSLVRSELSKRWGKLNGNAWHGIQIVANDGPTDMTASLGGRPKPVVQPSLLAPPVVLTNKGPLEASSQVETIKIPVDSKGNLIEVPTKRQQYLTEEKKRKQAELHGLTFPFEQAFQKKTPLIVPPVQESPPESIQI
jgi:phage/plasmid-associated DNA primase